MAAAQARGVQVSNTPDVLTDCVADLAWGLLIAAARRMGQGERFVRSGQWGQIHGSIPLGMRVSGKKLGIVGLGRIGDAIAKRGAGFDMQVRYHNRRKRDDVAYGYEASLVELARWADFLIVATVGGAGTRHLVNQEVLEALGPKGIVVNIARGPVIDETALVAALEAGKLGWAALDVFEHEPGAAGAAGQRPGRAAAYRQRHAGNAPGHGKPDAGESARVLRDGPRGDAGGVGPPSARAPRRTSGPAKPVRAAPLGGIWFCGRGSCPRACCGRDCCARTPE